MRILFAHNRYVIRGGEDESREQEMAMLRSRGHEIVEYVVDNRDVPRANFVATGLQAVWNTTQHRHISKLIRETRPDVLKVDNYFPILSPSIFDAAKSLGVATVLSVRNYRLICPAASLFRDGKVCTECIGSKVALPAILHKCYRGSHLQSAAVAFSNTYAHLRGTWTNSIDQFVAVSSFVKRQLVLGGFSPAKISVKPNSIVDTALGDGSGGYAIYVGRLTQEKGIPALLAAWQSVGAAMPLKIIGDGPLEAMVAKAAEVNPSIEFLRRKPIAEVCDYLGRAKTLVFPSQWLEPFGRTIIEAYSKGTPVIAADTEPMREMISEGRTGLLFKAGDSTDLAEKVLSFAADPGRTERMRIQARAEYLQKYSVEENYAQMMEIFSRVGATQTGSEKYLEPPSTGTTP